MIEKLNPATRGHYANTPPCQTGTRQEILDEIDKWAKDQSASETLFWLHGPAGMGKSSISASVCRKFEKECTLGAYFFCKRDDPELRNPGRILNTIVHGLASKFEPYSREVAHAIKGNASLPESPLNERYTHLIERPLEALKSKQSRPDVILFVVIDALDECEKGGERPLLLTYLRKMSQLVPWLKVVVTSRPDRDIKKAFGAPNGATVSSHDLLTCDYSLDILAFTQERMASVAKAKRRDAWPDDTIRELSKRACGLFIWVETACKFIEDGFDPAARLKKILEGRQPAGGSATLDMLYTTAIELCMGDDDEDNLNIIKQCLGAIASTSYRMPLSVDSLELLLVGEVNSGVFRNVVDGLKSVLYEDGGQGDAVRAYHPSFVDFILDQSRSKTFHREQGEQNDAIAGCCLGTMMRELRFNICGLETSSVLNRDVPDLESRVQARISKHLQYGCLYWSSHVTRAPKGTLGRLVRSFVHGRELLYWIEALSLLAKLEVAVSSLLTLVNLTQVGVFCALSNKIGLITLSKHPGRRRKLRKRCISICVDFLRPDFAEHAAPLCIGFGVCSFRIAGCTQNAPLLSEYIHY